MDTGQLSKPMPVAQRAGSVTARPSDVERHRCRALSCRPGYTGRPSFVISPASSNTSRAALP